MKVNEIIEDFKSKHGDTKIAVFYDKIGELQVAIIKYLPKVGIHIDVFNLNGIQTAFKRMYYHDMKRIYMLEIYVYEPFRGNKIAGILADLTDYILIDFIGYTLRGVKDPYQALDEKNQNITEEELNSRADAYYQSAGYQIIYYEEYKKNKKEYPIVDELTDFILNEEIPECIIMKKVELKSEYEFAEIDGLLVHKNALENIEEIKSKLNSDQIKR